MSSLFSISTLITAMISGVWLLAIGLPLVKGLRLALQAFSATRRMPADALRRSLEPSARAGVEPLSGMCLRVLGKALRDNQAGHPRDFLVEASRKVVESEYETTYAKRISMYANILPPIGFIGTLLGLLVLFISMQTSNASLELTALALTLVKSVFALCAFTFLEALKIVLYGRLLACLDDALALATPAEDHARPARPAAQPARA
jgi:biopolymer transport protein ExbB/TolQ